MFYKGYNFVSKLNIIWMIEWIFPLKLLHQKNKSIQVRIFILIYNESKSI